ncbi:hypothetical protein Tco_0251764 [Tanacetum coccineum]
MVGVLSMLPLPYPASKPVTVVAAPPYLTSIPMEAASSATLVLMEHLWVYDGTQLGLLILHPEKLDPEQALKCMTRSSSNELYIPYKDLEREFRSSKRHFKSLSFNGLRSPDFDLLSDQENSEEEEEEAMAETMEQYMSKTRTDYGSGVARPKIDNKDQFELKGQFLKELRENTFSGSDNEDANEHIEKVLEIVDLFHIPNITENQLML